MIIDDTSTPVVILKVEHYGGLGIIRTLGRLGIQVYGIDRNPRAPGFSSRYLREKLVWDTDRESEQSTIDRLLSLGRTIGRRSVLIATSDELSVLVARYADVLSEWFIYHHLPADLVRRLCSKQELYLLAGEQGIPTPMTLFPRCREDVVKYARTGPFPVVLKGISGRRLMTRAWRKLVIVRNERELLERYDAMEEPGDRNLIIQEYIGGCEDLVWMFNGYFNEHSECLLGFTGRKLRENPVYAGMTSLGICLDNPAVTKTATNFMKRLGYRGVVDIDYRYDTKDGTYKILDVNPRVGATFRLFVGAGGMDVVRAMYLDLTGQPVPEPDSPHEGRKWLVEDKDILSCYFYYRDGNLRVMDWLRSFDGVEESGYFALDDIRPFNTMAANRAKRQVQKFWRRLRAINQPDFVQEGSAAVKQAPIPTGDPKEIASAKDLTTAVVLSFGGSAGAYDMVRTLAMEGIPSIVASTEFHNIAFYSQHCTARVFLPEYQESNTGEILARLKKLSGGLLTKPVLFYISDPELTFVRKYRAELEPFYRFLLPQEDLLAPLFNKVLFSQLAVKYALPVPYTLVVKSIEDLRGIAPRIRFPAIVKPAYSQDWVWDTEEQREFFGTYKKALRRLNSLEELTRFCDALPRRSTGFLIQAYIEGRDETIVSFHAYFDEKSRCLGFFLGRKIRTYPPRTGGAVYVQTLHNPALAKLSIEYLERIGFVGIVKIDYKWDEAEGNFKILEINPRFNLWQLLGAYAGVNLTVIAYRHQMGETVVPPADYGEDVRLLFFKQDLRSFVFEYRKTGEWTLSSYVRSLAKKTYYRVFVPDDPIPFIVSALGFMRRNGLRLLDAVRRPKGHPQEHH